MSDLHVGEGLFRAGLLNAAIEEANLLAPDLVVVAGDLTMDGYRSEFESCRRFLDELSCDHVVVAMGNHDARNVGYRHFEDFFGARDSATTVPVGEGRAKVVTIDSTKPDLDEGEVGREHYGWLDAELRNWDQGPRIVVIHHHLLAVPGTGRDVNNLRDAGDVMAILREHEVDLVLSGHRHVPYVWSISGVRVVHSGTVSTLRLRGTMPPSYNVIEIDDDEVRIAMRQPGRGADGEEPLARFSRRPVTTSRFFPSLDRFVRYDAHPFPGGAAPAPPRAAEPIAAAPRDAGPTIVALLEGGPLDGTRIETEVIEGRPPKTLDLSADDGTTCRYCLADWVQAGPSAIYTFLYRV